MVNVHDELLNYRNIIKTFGNICVLIGCLLNQLDVFAGDVAHHEDVSNASACMDLCQKNKECELWTLISGMCFLKNEKAYPKALPHTFKYNAASGHKNCSSDGK